MALELTRSAKSYAEDGSATGVPLADLETIVGSLVERYRHSETITTASTGATAVLIAYKPLQFATEYRIFLTDSGGTVLLDAAINSLTWQGLVHAAVGDTLVHDGRNTQTGHSLTPVDGVTPTNPNIVLGRTEDTFLLIQGIALPVGAILDVFSTEFSGGEITERLWRQTSAAPHVVRLKGYFADQDAAEAAAGNIGYDGSFATGIATNNWQEQNDPYASGATGSGSEFLYRANATYNPLAARWLLSTVDIVSAQGGVTVEYAVSDTGPWHATQADTDKWRRWRDANMFWHVEPLNQLDDGWVFLLSERFNSSTSPATGNFNPHVFALSQPIHLLQWKSIMLEWQWGTSTDVSTFIVPLRSLPLADYSADTFTSGQARAAYFNRSGNGASYDDPDHDAADDGGAHRKTIIWQLMEHPTSPVLDEASHILIDIVETTAIGTFRMYVGR